MSSDKEIDKYLKSLKRGKPCLTEFFNAYSGRIKLIAHMYLVDRSFVDDVVMNTFCSILNGIQTYDENNNGMAWVRKIAQNEAYKINARERKHAYLPLEDVSEELASVGDFTDNSEFMTDVTAAINKLEELDKQIVTMRFFDGLLFPEIAANLNMYVGTVFKRYRRALKQISKDVFGK